MIKKLKITLIMFLFIMGMLVSQSYADLYVQPYFIALSDTTADNARWSAINTTSNINSGTYFLVHQAYLEEHSDNITKEVLEKARLVVPRIVSSCPFEEANVNYPVPTYGLREGLYQMLAFDANDNLVLISKEVITITQAEIEANEQLKSILFLDKEIPNFEPEILNYAIVLTEEETLRIHSDYLSAVSAIPVDSETLYEKYISEDPNVVIIDPYREGPMIISAPNYVYSVTFMPYEEPEIDVPETPDEEIEIINREIDQLVEEGITGAELRERLSIHLKRIHNIVLTIEDSDIAERTYMQISNTLIKVGNAIKYVDESPPVVRQISVLTDVARRLLGIIENASSAANLTVDYFDSIHPILRLINLSDYQTKNLKNKVYDLAEEAVIRTGTFQASDQEITIEGVSMTARFNMTKVLERMEEADISYRKVNGAMKRLLGYSDPRNLAPQLKLSVKKVENAETVTSEISSEILAAASARRYEALGIDVGEVGVTFETGLLKGNDQLLRVHATFETNDQVRPPAGAFRPGEGFVAAISMETDQSEIKVFDKPIEIRFDLNEWEMNDLAEMQGNDLSLFVLDESINRWKTVGGNYDPIKDMIRTMRMKLSKYTVMKTQKAFSDLGSSWAEDEINELLGKGIVDDSTYFLPKTDVTRDDFTTWLSRAYGLSKEELMVPFLDVSVENPHYIEISTAYDQGIINGKSETSFDPAGFITREEIATIVSNALTILENRTYNPELESNIKKYNDYDAISYWAKNTVSLVDELGIMRGDDINFRPKDNVTREEAASIIKRVYD